MSLTIENFLLVGSLLLLLSIIAGKTSYRLGFPMLVLFLGVGMLAGSEALGGIKFDDPSMAQFIGIVSLNFILFSGGLDTNWNTVKPVLWQGVSLSTLGVIITAVTTGVFVWYISDLNLYEALLLGSIISSTDAAAVFSMLRSKSLALKSNLRPLLELESGSNDPMAYVLTISFLTLVMYPEMGLISVLPQFLIQMSLGALGGLLFGFLSRWVINKINLQTEGLYIVLVIAMMFAAFSATDFIGGNGFLAVYISAVYLGNKEFIHKKTIIKMYDGLAWLMQIILFLTLGLLVFPSEIEPYVGMGLLISVFLILIARPLSVFISLAPFKMRFRNRLFISWVGLRGAVPIVFATYPLIAGMSGADMIFNIVFFVSVTSVLLQGTTLSAVAKWLHVALPVRVKQRSVIDLLMAESPKTAMTEISVSPGDYAAGKKVVDLRFPSSSIIAMIKRNDKYITPGGSTMIEIGDVLIILVDNQDVIPKVYEKLGKPYPEPEQS